jgi:hypothetical protein
MIKLKSILESLENEKNSDLILLDDWKLTEIDYLMDMGFNQDGDYSLTLNKPKIKVYKKKKINHKLSTDLHALGEGYIIEDEEKNKKYIFPTFGKMVNFFDNYEQDFKL